MVCGAVQHQNAKLLVLEPGLAQDGQHLGRPTGADAQGTAIAPETTDWS